MSQQGLGNGPLENVSRISGGTQNIMLRFTRSGRPCVLRRGPKHLRPRSNVVNMRETFDDMTRAGAVSDEKRGQLAEIFMMSSRLEGMFWEMAYTLDQWPDLR